VWPAPLLDIQCQRHGCLAYMVPCKYFLYYTCMRAPADTSILCYASRTCPCSYVGMQAPPQSCVPGSAGGGDRSQLRLSSSSSRVGTLPQRQTEGKAGQKQSSRAKGLPSASPPGSPVTTTASLSVTQETAGSPGKGGCPPPLLQVTTH
jgi:hypothetical protein